MPTVVLDLVGFWIPFDLSLAFTVILAAYRKFRTAEKGLVRYLALVISIGLVATFLFEVSPNPQTLELPKSWSLSLMLGSGVLYALVFWGRRLIAIGVFEVYAVGTYAMILSDLVRTYLLPLPVSVPTIYIGGGGERDMILNAGLFMVGVFTTINAGAAIWRRELIEKLVGPKWAALFWTEWRKPKPAERDGSG